MLHLNVTIIMKVASAIFYLFSIIHFRMCLDLFPTPPPPELRSELNLIASLSLLDDFGIKMLPVQVRLCENKLDLIRSCLDSSPSAYKNYNVVG